MWRPKEAPNLESLQKYQLTGYILEIIPHKPEFSAFGFHIPLSIMSRRAPNPAADRAAQNTTTIKNLLKLEGNKTCADCKRNKREYSAEYNHGWT